MERVGVGARRRYRRGVRYAEKLGGALPPVPETESIRHRRATQPPAHFQRNPPGRGQLAVFPRCSLGPHGSDMGASLAP